MPATQLTYVFDAYCGWCYGFGPALREFAARHAIQVEIEVLSGGLFVGRQLAPLRAMSHIAQANKRIEQLTGTHFGEGYRRLVEDGSFVMDSGAASIGFAALRAEAPRLALELAGAMQQAFYHTGLSLSDPATYAQIADAHRLDAGAVLTRMQSTAAAALARSDIARSRSLGVRSFPTLLLQTPTGVARLGGPTSTAAQLSAALDECRQVAPAAS